MNKKGQTLVLFIILIPILLGLAALLVDTSYIVSKNVELKELSRTIITKLYQEDDEQKIIEMFKNNDIPVENLEIDKNSDWLKIKNTYEIESIFGKIIGLNKYKIKVNITGKFENGKIKFE